MQHEDRKGKAGGFAFPAQPRLAAVGECMVELVQAGADAYERRHGGDTLNTATYLARLTAGRSSVAYATRLGMDGFSDAMVAAWLAEGIDTSLVARIPGRLPGLYIIETNSSGERSFLYWRREAPAREMFTAEGSAALIEALLAFDLIYLSGITLAILPEAGRAGLVDLLARRRAAGRFTAYDPNYRPSLWSSPDEARDWTGRLLPHCHLALPSTDDLARMFGGPRDGPYWLDLLAALGPADIVLKDGGQTIHTRCAGKSETFALTCDQSPVDTTGAGDSFNAGYLAAILAGRSNADAVAAGHRLAATVIRHRGAIIPVSAMPQ